MPRRRFDESKHSRNKYGKLVSKKRSEQMMQSPWAAAIKQARTELNIQGFEPIRKGSALYERA